MFRLRRLSTPQDAHAAASGERGDLPHRARVVSADPSGRLFLFSTCGDLSVTCLNPVPPASSVSNARDAYTAAAGVRCTSTRCRNCRPYGHCGLAISFHNL